MLFDKIRNIHFVGIGGIGMSGIAEILFDKGFNITGSDLKSSEITEKLEKKGIKIIYGHKEENINSKINLVVISSAIKMDNVEVIKALEIKITLIKRAEMLAEMMRMSYGIGIAGCHGKSTTSSMCGIMLRSANLSPTVIVGGIIQNIDSNSLLGESSYFVVEADEYDRTFLSLSPIIVGITNIDVDHLDIYKDFSDIKKTFIEFSNKVPFFGCVVACLDDSGVQDILPFVKKRIITYGLSRQADIRAENIVYENFKTTYSIIVKGKNLGEMTIYTSGRHNVLNSLMCVAIGFELNLSIEQIKNGLENFKGVKRRLEKKAEVKNITIFDDYAHHPLELKTTIAGLRQMTSKRIVVIFQPHLYSRTRDFYMDFGKSFIDADKVFITPIYPARETPMPGISGKMIVDAAIQCGHHNVCYINENEKIVDTIIKDLKENDVLITFGAGDIYKYGEKIIHKLQES